MEIGDSSHRSGPLATNIARLKHRDETERIVRAWFLDHTAEEAMHILNSEDVSASPIYTIADIFSDEHFSARRAIIDVPDSDFGTVKMQSVVPRFSETPGCVWRTGPGLGENNHDVLCNELGISPSQLDELRARKVI
jgi:crotonobetainyl-CoA:carnitine CoA-transferase CaiB-like acyl-CoA transferase